MIIILMMVVSFMTGVVEVVMVMLKAMVVSCRRYGFVYGYVPMILVRVFCY